MTVSFYRRVFGSSRVSLEVLLVRRSERVYRTGVRAEARSKHPCRVTITNPTKS